MKIIGLKLICERFDGQISTWHDTFEKTIEEVINEKKSFKGWIGGKFLEAYLEFEDNGKYYKVYLDVDKQGLNELLKR